MEKGLRETLMAAGDRYWEDTKTAFESGANEVEAKYAEYRTTLRKLVGEPGIASKTTIESLLRRLQELNDFFGAIPWKSVS